MRNFARTSLWIAATATIVATVASPIVAQAEGGTRVPGASADSTAADVVVTATKRAGPLSRVAGSVTAVTQAQLRSQNAPSLSGKITRTPGVVFSDCQPGVSEAVFGGVASSTYHEANQATTGYYINQIPLVEPGFPLVIPDIDAFDPKQVEVLRGPQGTLFGSSSLGGAVYYVANEAESRRLDADGEGIVSFTARAGEPNYAVKAMVNLPVMQDRLAVRAVALQRYDAGYLDNVGTGQDGSNDLRVRGLHGSAVWTPTPDTTVSGLAMFQEYDLGDQTYVLFGQDPNERTFTHDTSVPDLVTLQSNSTACAWR